MMRINLLGAVFLAGVAAILLFAPPPQHAGAQQINTSVVPVSSASAEATHVLKAGPGHLYQIFAGNGTATAGFLAVIDSATVPSDGAITPILCAALPASGNVSVSFLPTPPLQFNTGITAILTSNASCLTKTTGVITGYIEAIVQ